MVAQPPTRTIENNEWKILIIDDDEDDFLIAREMLQEAKGRKIHVHWANTYDAGRKELFSDHYNAVLVDYDLGIHSGIHLIREANERGYPSPLILFTGRGNYEVDVEAMEAGATLYLTKSEVNPLLLERAIRYAIELKQKEQTLRNSEAALRESEAREREKAGELNAVLDATPAIVWITHDPQAYKVDGNQAAHDFLRVPPGKNLSKSAPTDAPRNFQVYKDNRELAPEELPLQVTAATGEPIRNFEEEVVFEDGDRAYLLGNVTPLLDDDEKPCGAVGAFINITERKQAERALEKAEERFAKAFHSSPAALAIARASDGRYIEANEALCQVTGYERDEIIGHTALELGIYAHPDQRAELIRLLKVHGVVRNYELTIRTKAGIIRSLLGSFDFVELDNELCMLATLIDITERKQAEEAQRASEDRFAKAFNANPNAQVISRIEDGRIEIINDSFVKLFGYQREEALGKTSLELNMFAQPAQRQEAVRHIQTNRFLRDYELDIQTKSGEIRRASLSVELVLIGSETLMLTVIQDITDRMQTEQALRDSERRLRDFVENTRNNYIALDRQWRFTYANPHYGELMGVNPEDLIGKNYWELFPQYLGTELEQNYRKVMEAGAPLHFRQGGLYTASQFEVSVYPTQEGLAIFSIDRTEESRHQWALENERTRLEAVLESLPVGVWITDTDGRIVGKNAQADHIWAGDAPMAAGVEQYREYHSWDVQTGKVVETEDFPLAKALSTGQPVEPKEHCIQRFDGSEGFVLVSAMPIKDSEGRLTGAVAINVDITGRKRAEHALKQAEEKFSKAFLYNPVALTITRVSDGRYLEVNEAFYQLTGYSSEEIIGHTVHDIALYIDPDQRAEMINRVKIQGRLRNYEIKIRDKAGAIRTILTSIDPIEIATEAWIITTFIDITERKETEQALRKSESELRTSEAMLRDFLENSHESFFILDRNWRFQYINRNMTNLLHTSAEALAGKIFWEAFPAYLGTPVEQHYQKVMNERVPMHFQMGGVYTPIWFDISVYPTQQGIGVFAIDRTEEKRAQEALLESRERLKRAQQIAHLGSWELNLADNRLSWSDEVYRIFGLQPQEFAATYEAFLEHVHPEDRSAVDGTYINSVKQNLDGYEIEHRVIRAHTGEVRFVHEKCEHIRDANGQIIRSVGMIHDITERKQAETRLQERNEALRASEAVLEAFFANSPGILNIEDENFRYIKTDPLTPTYFGLDRQSIIGKAVKDLAPEFIKNFGPILRRVIETGHTESREVYSPVPGRPGEITYWQASYFPVPLPGGKRGIGVMGVEITGQKKTEQALELERAKLAAAIEQIPVGVCIGDAQGNVLTMNNAGLELHEFSSEAEMFSRAENYLQEFELRYLDGSPIPVDEWPSSKALRGVFVQNFEVRLHNLQTGKERVVAYSAAPVKNNEGETILIVYTMQDLTERKEAEMSLQHYANELERSNQALQDFAFIASHDLQEPLRKIIMFGNSLRSHLCDTPDEAAENYIGRMQNAAERMQVMINGLLDLSRINARGGDFAQIDLNGVTNDVVSDLEARIHATNAQVIIDNLPDIEADEMQIRRLFQNLIGNAIKFQKPDVPPVVSVSGKVDRTSKPPMAEIRIEDNGIGFEQDYAERIFQPFQRLHGRTAYEGTGLGLAICKKIVERHHGKIEAQSLPGRGSIFIVILPIKQAS